MKIYCCKNCVDIALDEAVDETEMPPILNLLSEEQMKLSTSCHFCKDPAAYIITNS